MKNQKLFNTLTVVFLALILFCCQTANETDGGEKNFHKRIKGNWAFLNVAGHYNEAYFGDSTYVTYNHLYGKLPDLEYEIKGDSLYSVFNRGEVLDSLRPIAEIEWLDEDHFVIIMQDVRDTLQRIKSKGVTLDQFSKPKEEKFREDFTQRHEEFLIERGILTKEEVEQQREKRKAKRDSLALLKRPG